MASTTRTAAGMALLVVVATAMAVCKADLDQDRAECADQLVGLATCLPYVGGDSKAPTIDCCSGLKTVLEKSKKCVCVLIKDRDDPNLGLKINATLALGLPAACHAPTNITQCIDLLHLSPNSTDAKVFEGNSSSKSSTTTTIVTAPIASEKANITSSGSMGSSANSVNHGRRINRGLGLEIICAALIWFFTPNLVSNYV